ncbi:Abi family protein [Roseateles chitinivorans]|uniref:Abi family protein n=1 Tax=Roseateles chitinivorans TaxID=2917965 RepID=UPI003D67980F
MITLTNPHAASHSGRAQSFSQARLSSYRTFLGAVDDAQALALHEWNDELSVCLFRLLRKIEIVLRNQLHKALSARYGALGGPGSKDWYAHVALSTSSMEKIRKITHFHQGTQHLPRVPPPSPDDVVSKLTFGFWPHLLDLARDAQRRPVDWGSMLLDVLPGHRQRQASYWAKRKHQDALFARLVLCNDLRNRIAHHEPIWKFGPLLKEAGSRLGSPVTHEAPAPTSVPETLARLLLIYGRLTELLGWLSPETAAHHAVSELDQRCRTLMQIEAVLAHQHALQPATIDLATVSNLRVLRKTLRHASRRQQPALLKDGHRTLGNLTCQLLRE